MKNYVIARNKENQVTRIDNYDETKFSVEVIKKKISEWTATGTFELVEDEKTIEILNYYFRIEEVAKEQEQNESLEQRNKRLEDAIDDIENILLKL